MNAPQSSSSDSFGYFAAAVLGVAVLLGVCFVYYNAEVDQQRQAAVERWLLCSQMERVASVASVRGVRLSTNCRTLSEQGHR
ncbi:hypothetical protein TU79_07605 [Pseudomonas trivialis]|uniref:Uncharacterized protein n=1 Tax=Pseudomonas trivialis TaxID=200450 RepID=A0A0R2ZKY1_9PSED|nr:hypothetical protein TU79_07605 [Pseudomonas trivialis]